MSVVRPNPDYRLSPRSEAGFRSKIRMQSLTPFFNLVYLRLFAFVTYSWRLNTSGSVYLMTLSGWSLAGGKRALILVHRDPVEVDGLEIRGRCVSHIRCGRFGNSRSKDSNLKCLLIAKTIII